MARMDPVDEKPLKLRVTYSVCGLSRSPHMELVSAAPFVSGKVGYPGMESVVIAVGLVGLAKLTTRIAL